MVRKMVSVQAVEGVYPLTLPWLKPRDSCELGLLVLGR